jgi:hypothetical protein
MSVRSVLSISLTPTPLMADTMNTRAGRGSPACFNLQYPAGYPGGRAAGAGRMRTYRAFSSQVQRMEARPQNDCRATAEPPFKSLHC